MQLNVEYVESHSKRAFQLLNNKSIKSLAIEIHNS